MSAARDSMLYKTSLAATPPYVTRDGSQIRELLHPDHHPVRQQSLAEATVPPGTKTLLHCHQLTEEIYHVTAGRGRMRLGDEEFEVGVGDSILIIPGTPHCIACLGDAPLRILCCCAPPYSHEDTRILE